MRSASDLDTSAYVIEATVKVTRDAIGRRDAEFLRERLRSEALKLCAFLERRFSMTVEIEWDKPRRL